ncbi:MAG: hypothetical protein ACHQNE_10305, partial [Candidatus Kapaibacterium sp.]
MKILRNQAPLFLLLAFASVEVFGCKNNSTSPNSTTSAIPTIGSAFTMIWNGGYSLTSYDTVATASLADPAHNGSKVIRLIETINGQIDSTFESFETNGDMAVMGSTWGDPGSFETLPFVSQSPMNSSFTGPAGLVTISAIGSGAGKPFLLNGTSYATDSVTVSVINSNDTDRFPYSYIPALGLICIENYVPGSSNVTPTTQ